MAINDFSLGVFGMHVKKVLADTILRDLEITSYVCEGWSSKIPEETSSKMLSTMNVNLPTNEGNKWLQICTKIMLVILNI